MIGASNMEHDEAHTYMMYKGLMAVAGVVFFYFVERALTITAGRWALKKKDGKVNFSPFFTLYKWLRVSLFLWNFIASSLSV